MHNDANALLYPDREQQLFEILSMDPVELKSLNYMRDYVKMLREQVQNESKSIKE